MKRFILRLLLWVLLPLLLSLSLFFLILERSGEFCDPYATIARSATEESLVVELQFHGTDFVSWFKGLSGIARRAQTLVLGTSRSMQFRQCMLPDAPGFYNAGGAVTTVSRMRPYLEHLEALPTTLLVGLDQYFFNENWVAWQTEAVYDMPEAAPFNLKDALDTVARRIGTRSFSIPKVLTSEPRYVGLPASARCSGFSQDGSYHYGIAADDAHVDLTFSDALARIRQKNTRFEAGDSVYQPSVEAVEDLLAYCSSHEIEVVAYLPPYPPTVYNAMQQDGNYTYLQQIYPTLLPLFEKYGFELYDFTFMPTTTDEQYVDGFHAGDIVYAEMLRQMAAQGKLGEFTGEAVLRDLMAHAVNPRVIEPEP